MVYLCMTVCSNHALLFFCDLQTCEQAVKSSRTRKRELNACLTTCSRLQPAALLFKQLTNALRESTAERLHVIGIVDFLAAAFQTIAILCSNTKMRSPWITLPTVAPRPSPTMARGRPFWHPAPQRGARRHRPERH